MRWPWLSHRRSGRYLHRGLVSDPYRIVLGTDLRYGEWTRLIDKDPSDRPVALGE
jgi:hypothetical protein